MSSQQQQQQQQQSNSHDWWFGIAVIVGGGCASWLRTTLMYSIQGKIARRLRYAAWHALFIENDYEHWMMMTMRKTTTTTTRRTTRESKINNKKKKKKNTITKQEQQQPSSSFSQSTMTLAKTRTIATKEKTPKNDNDDDNDDDDTTTIAFTPAVVSSILEQNVNQISQAMTMSLMNGLRSTSALLYSTYQMIYLDVGLFGITLIVIPMVGIGAIILRQVIQQMEKYQYQLAIQATQFVEERLQQYAWIQTSAKQIQEVQYYQEKILQQEAKYHDRIALFKGIYMGFVFTASATALISIVVKG